MSLSPLFLTSAGCLFSLWHCVLCQPPLVLALISGKLSVRMCYVRWCYIVIFAANVRMGPFEVSTIWKSHRSEVETQASRLSGITAALIRACDQHVAGAVNASLRSGFNSPHNPCYLFIHCLFSVWQLSQSQKTSLLQNHVYHIIQIVPVWATGQPNSLHICLSTGKNT